MDHKAHSTVLSVRCKAIWRWFDNVPQEEKDSAVMKIYHAQKPVVADDEFDRPVERTAEEIQVLHAS
jgi:hypothetical protein